MSGITSIEWTELSWNPVTGCSKISSGCANCYAEKMAKRLYHMNNIRYLNGFDVTLHEDLIEKPLDWGKPKRIFVNSMSDLFHEEVPIEFIKRVFETMNRTPWHTYQVLTKRSERLLEVAPYLNWTNNIWQGVSVENDSVMKRVDNLRMTQAKIKFLSVEPLLGSLRNLDLKGIDWVIVGGESGAGARRMEPDWVREIRDKCVEEKIPFFFKQWGGTRKHKTGKTVDGLIWSEYPNVSL